MSLEISVVVPAYNEKECIGECVREIAQALARTGRTYEILVVDDGSTDGTFEILRGMKQSVPQLRAIRFESNRGQTAAMEAGFRNARGDIVITLDADLQNDPSDIPKLLDLMSDFDVVCGVRVQRRDTFVRRISSRIGNAVRNWITRDRVTDTGCTLKAYRREFLNRLKLFNGLHRFLPTLLRLTGAKVTEIPVNHRPRKAGTSKYGIGNRMFRGLYDCLAVRWMQKRWINYRIKETLE